MHEQGFIFKETVYAITSPSQKKEKFEIKIISQLCFLIRCAEGHREQCIFDSYTWVQLIGQSLRWLDMQMCYIKGWKIDTAQDITAKTLSVKS